MSAEAKVTERPKYSTAAEQRAYEAGYEAGKRGANMVNCHFTHFQDPYRTAAWSRGNNDGSHQREQAAKKRSQP